jgi:hypothetical protein
MEPRSSKLQRQQETHAESLRELRSESGHQEFNTVEEMLRKDADMTEVPPELAGRVANAVASEPRPARSWWRRWFSRS